MKEKMPTVKELIESGAHFGHLKAHSHPRAKQFAFEIRDKVIIIDLDKTIETLKQAADFCYELAKQGKTLLFVGTKKQAQDVIMPAAQSVAMPYVNNRWLAGTLTNFEEIVKNIRRLEQLETKLKESSDQTKREKINISKKIEKFHKLLDGIRQLGALPDALIVVDAATESTTIEEANKVGIPIIAITDTNADPQKIDYPIPANDDSKKTIELILNVLAKAISQGKEKLKRPIEKK